LKVLIFFFSTVISISTSLLISPNLTAPPSFKRRGGLTIYISKAPGGGEKTGPNPNDRRRLGSKVHEVSGHSWRREEPQTDQDWEKPAGMSSAHWPGSRDTAIFGSELRSGLKTKALLKLAARLICHRNL
jgi:hypothetical protein